jgi:uncharacterized damage-inducible protein DinB
MAPSTRSRRAAVGALLSQLDEAYDRQSWHGPNLRGSLRGLTVDQVVWRPAPGRHNVWETAVHAAYWKYAAWRRLTGEKRGAFPRKGSNWFPSPGSPTERAWREELALLREFHGRLRAAVERLTDDELGRKAPGGNETIGRLVRGVAAHDLYHAGQIQLLKRLRHR